jgi:hypothetical protein
LSPTDNGVSRVYRDKDGFLRDERGLKSMAHLAVMMSMSLSFAVGLSGLIAFFLGYAESTQLITAAVGLSAAGSGLEGWQSHIEGRNQREAGQ